MSKYIHCPKYSSNECLNIFDGLNLSQWNVKIYLNIFKNTLNVFVCYHSPKDMNCGVQSKDKLSK